jgi:rhodanese-related sulfurtransferase
MSFFPPREPFVQAACAALLTLLVCGCDGGRPEAGDRLQEEFRQLTKDFDQETGARPISVVELTDRLREDRKVVLLDTRERQEFVVGHLDKAILLPPSKVATDALELAGDPLVVTYCTAGYRSGLAATALEDRLGIKVYSLSGGIIDWFNNGGRVVDEEGRPVDKVHTYNDDWKKYLIERR